MKTPCSPSSELPGCCLLAYGVFVSPLPLVSQCQPSPPATHLAIPQCLAVAPLSQLPPTVCCRNCLQPHLQAHLWSHLSVQVAEGGGQPPRGGRLRGQRRLLRQPGGWEGREGRREEESQRPWKEGCVWGWVTWVSAMPQPRKHNRYIVEWLAG